MRSLVSSFANNVRISRASNVRTMAMAVKYAANGPASEVYKLENIDAVTKLAANEVSLKFLAAPINPSDINLANGTYGKKVPLPAIGGNEGVAVVEQVGAQVKSVKVGDWVLPAVAPFGTWTQAARATEDQVIPVSKDIPAAYAATLAVNPGSAYRMLRDFVQLKAGDVIIQNGANSMVGLAVIQMAREMGVKTINVIRSDRPGGDQVLRLLSNLGGDINIPDTYLHTADFKELISGLPPIKLALNCVGGEVATDMARVVGSGATLVTYGGMSKQPLSVPADLVAAKQLSMKGFWISQWFESHSIAERKVMLDDITTMIKEKKLSFFFEMHDFDDFAFALKKSQEPFRFRKVVLNLDYPDRMKEHDARPNSDYEVFEAPAN